jgi:hypothetical protein
VTQRELDNIEIKRVTFELERTEAIDEANVLVDIQGNTPFHATTYARNMLVAKILVCGDDESIQYITLLGEEITLTKDEAKTVLASIVERQDFFWQEYFTKVRNLYAQA